ncbi:hypothetical protein COUCH_04790 [Couchioplanes caeruleus]|uniref:hypothetical protein n=1 Tax=Couchioplanes caeruleus TaxID=56438 RepID=UPI0020BF82E1|nr:hypothetical protein [Couchioplanes caeruleus]UQU65646.1 hypothetical protein COUCH_04790 [Couchioplanes caeruleus]
MPVPPEAVEAPADDAVLFRSSPWRTFSVMFAVLFVAYVAVSPLVAHLLGAPRDAWWTTAAQATVIGVVVAGGYALTSRSALRTWVRASSGGLELASEDSDPVLLAWPDIDHVVVRRSGLRTVLDVTPVDLDRVHPVAEGDDGWPALHDEQDGSPSFTADLTQVWPGPRALRRELARRMR